MGLQETSRIDQTIKQEASRVDQRIEQIEKRIAFEPVLEQWIDGHPDLIDEHGWPGPTVMPVDTLWYQFFDRGYILYNASSGWTIVLKYNSKEWEKFENPQALITQHGLNEIDNDLLSYLKPNGVDVEYMQLIENRSIIGGIGTLFVKHDLYAVLGDPLHTEQLLDDSAFIQGPVYDLFVGVMNRHTDKPQDRGRAVVVLFKDGRYEKHTVNLRLDRYNSIKR